MLKAGNEHTSKTSMDVVQVFFLDFEQETAGFIVYFEQLSDVIKAVHPVGFCKQI